VRNIFRVPKKLVAKDALELYDMVAVHYGDPTQLANREGRSTWRKLERVASRLPLEKNARMLDVGPGDGTLFRITMERVAHCCGVDPSPNAVQRLNAMFEDAPNVEFVAGSANEIPYPDDEFDIVVTNSVLLCLPSREDIRSAVAELVRVCRPGGVVFVGELPFRSELDRGILVHQARKLWESGLRSYVRHVFHLYLRPLLRGEPIFLFPARNLHFPAAEFECLCERLGTSVECRRHLVARRASMTRNNYLLRLDAGTERSRDHQDTADVSPLDG
jgi:ubiquinone/menaquinone biosynthesis C-methylase UbiE